LWLAEALCQTLACLAKSEHNEAFVECDLVLRVLMAVIKTEPLAAGAKESMTASALCQPLL
jgi:hypothetical protein